MWRRDIHLQELSIHMRQRHCGGSWHLPEGSSNRKSLFVKESIPGGVDPYDTPMEKTHHNRKPQTVIYKYY